MLKLLSEYSLRVLKRISKLPLIAGGSEKPSSVLSVPIIFSINHVVPGIEKKVSGLIFSSTSFSFLFSITTSGNSSPSGSSAGVKIKSSFSSRTIFIFSFFNFSSSKEEAKINGFERYSKIVVRFPPLK